MSEAKLGCPKLVNSNDEWSQYSIKVGDTHLTNIAEFNLDLATTQNPTLTITVVDPEVDVKIGQYHITSTKSENGRRVYYHIEDTKTGENIVCQRVTYNSERKMLFIGMEDKLA